MLAAGSLLTGSKVVKTGELWAGRPAKYMRALTKAEIDYIATSEANYSKHAEEYLAII
jgi:carbonic anhydrase/acetyltransferase-like protein (isoleucine patch superfamily)